MHVAQLEFDESMAEQLEVLITAGTSSAGVVSSRRRSLRARVSVFSMWAAARVST